MHIREAVRQLKMNIEAGCTTIVQSPPGMGKTWGLVGAVTKWFVDKPDNKGKRLGLSIVFMATKNPTSANGLPWKATRKYTIDGKEYEYTFTDPAAPEWFMARDLKTGEVLPASMFDHVILILEEWGQGGAETKKAYAEVLRAGGTPPYYLPPGSPIIALSNVDSRDGITKEFDFVINRIRQIILTPSVTVWDEDFAQHPYQWNGRTWMVTPFSRAWANRHGGTAPGELFEPKPEQQGPWCTCRSFTDNDRYVQIASAEFGGIENVMNEAWFLENMTGSIGVRAATTYVQELQFLKELPSKDVIVEDPLNAPMPTRGDLQLLLAYMMAAHAEENDLQSLIQYFERQKNGRREFPQDMTISFVNTLLRRDYNFALVPAMKGWTVRNSRILSAVATLSKQ